MVDESIHQSLDAGSNQTAHAVAAGHEEGGARGILREAIQKVMHEIEHHEKEARHHLQQAAELRKALRESISFLNEQGEKKPTAIARTGRSDKAGGPVAEEKEKPAASSNKQHRSKKK